MAIHALPISASSEGASVLLLISLQRSYKERPRHLCKVTRTFFIGAHQRSRYDHFAPLGMFDTERVSWGLVGLFLQPQEQVG